MKRRLATAVMAIGLVCFAARGADAIAPPEPVTAGPVTATVVSTYYSTAATTLVVVVEITTTETVDAVGTPVYVGPDGQQVEADDTIEPDEVFAGATAVVVASFPAATPGGSVMWTVWPEESDRVELVLPLDSVATVEASEPASSVAVDAEIAERAAEVGTSPEEVQMLIDLCTGGTFAGNDLAGVIELDDSLVVTDALAQVCPDAVAEVLGS